MSNFQAFCQMAHKLFGRKTLLLDAKKQEISRFSRRIGGYLIDNEIFGMNFAKSTYPFSPFRHPRERIADKEFYSQVCRFRFHFGSIPLTD